MGRPPFDPSRLSSEPEDDPDKPYRTVPETERLSVGQLSALIKETLERRIPSPLRVVGEVSNLSARNHWYFSLKDDAAVIGCVAWASSTRGFGFTPADGDEVVVTGHVGHYAPQGRTQFYVTGMKPVGAGALQQQFERLCRELREAGYFDEARKRPLPVLPRRIAVISSAGGAAVHDVMDTARRRFPGVGLLLVDVRVQGDGAAAEVAEAIRRMSAEHARLGVDALLVTRGGGSIEDLWAFNERVVADATREAAIPVVAAIGHESDTTIIELVADRRAATPTQAAMMLVPSRDELQQQVEHLGHRLRERVRRRIESARARIEAAERHAVLRSPAALLESPRARIAALRRGLTGAHRHRASAARIRFERLAGRLAAVRGGELVARRRERLARLGERLQSVVLARIVRSRAALDAAQRTLHAVDPREVLHRGYTWTTDEAGTLLRSAADVRAGMLIRTHFADGVVDARVEGRRRRRGRKDGERGDQLDLFRPDG